MTRAVALFSRILFALVVAGLPLMNPALAGGPGAVRVLDIGDLSTSFNEASTNWGQSNPSSIYSAGFRRYGIDKLADALNNDPVEIYRYVKNTIRTVPKYGVHKGAIGAMIDGEGTVFDQVHLMAQLLTAAGYSPTYKVGRITLTGQEFEDWFGIDDARDACELLTDGGYPVWINGNRCSQVSSGAITTVEMSHAWITVGAQIYDPGYKKQTRYAGIDLGTAMGFNGTTLWSDASPTTGTSSGIPYVTDVDRTALESRLTTYASTLADDLEANHHAKSIREVVGGIEVEHEAVPDTGPGTPGYTLTEKASYTTGFPNKFLTTIRIRCAQDIDKTFYFHEVYARRIFLRRTTSKTRLVIGEDVVDQDSNYDCDDEIVKIEVDYPYPASSGNAGDFDEFFNDSLVGSGSEATIILGADGATGGLIDRFQTDAYEDMEPVTGSLGTEAPTDLIDIEVLIGANWLVQLSMLRDLHSGIAGAEHIHHGTFGIIAGGTSIYTDIRSHISVELPGDPAADTEAAIQNLTSAMSAVEGAVLTQMLDSDASGTDPKPASVTGMFMAENDANSRFYEVTSANFNTAKTKLSGYSAGALYDLENRVADMGYTLLLPENGNLTAAGWTGYAALGRKSGDDSVGHFLGDDTYGDTWPLKGAAGENQNTANSEDNLMVPVDTAFAPAGAGVDPLTGRLAYSMTDITVGTGSFPYALPFTRTYNPSVRSGERWTHNYQITGRFSGDAYLAMGSRSPAEAARTIVALYAGLELLKVSRAKERLLTTLVIHDWLRRGLCHNVFVINSSASATALFKRPDGTYAMPDQGTSSLAIAGTGGNTTVTYTARGGMEMVFKPIDATEPDPQAFRITDWDWPQGVDLNFTYETNGDMTVANNLGWSMEIKGGAEFDEVEAGFSGSKRYVFYTRPTSGSDEGKITEVKISTFSSGASSDIIAEYGYGDGSKLDIYPTESNPTFGPNTYPLIRYEFDSVGRVKSVERVPEVGIGEGQDYTVVQASMGLITRFYPGGVVGRVEAPSGASSMVRVGRFGRWSESVDGLGRVGRSERDGRGRVTRAQAPEGNATEFTYDIYDNVLTQTLKAKPGSGLSDISSTFEYDNGPTTPFARRHVLTKATDALNNDTTYEYFDDGQLKKVTAPAAPVNGGTSQSAVTQYEYNSRGLVTKITDPDGIETAITVNGKGQVTKTIADALGLAITTRFYYDNYGNLDEIKDHRNKITTNSYNVARGWLTNVDRPLGSETSFSYNVLGQVTSERHKIDTTWFDIDRVYDDAFRLIEIADEAGDTTKFRYHVGDFSTSDEPYREVEDASGRVMRSYFDEAGQVTETVALFTNPADNISETTGYNDNGTVAWVKDGKGNQTDYTYDGFDRPKRTTFPGGSYEEIQSYDAVGRPLTTRNRAGDVFTLTYDALGRIATRAAPGVGTYAYEYDIRGQVTKAKLGTDAITYTYDALGRVLSEKDAANRTTSYAYDDTNNEVRLTWPTSQWVDYENDSLNRLETIRNSAGAALADYTYDTMSRVTAIDYGNGATQSYTYENDGDLDTVVQNFSGTADDVTFDYAYNAAGQVTSKDLTNNAYLFTPGANVTTSYTTNNLNQYTNIGGQAISYDTKGNLTSDGTLTFIYDSENKLKEAKDGAVTIGTYSYDPVGRRAEKTASGVTTEYAYAGVDVIAEYNGTGTLLRRIVPGGAIDAPIAFYDEDAPNDPIFYLHYDGQGSVIGVSDSTGANTEKYTYGPFGETPDDTGSPYHYVARRIDQETGLYYVRARYYSPEIGRFLSPDPIGYGDGLNMYAYVSNDPVNSRDPSGMFEEIIVYGDDSGSGRGGGTGSSGSAAGRAGSLNGGGSIEEIVVTPQIPLPDTGFSGVGAPPIATRFIIQFRNPRNGTILNGPNAGSRDDGDGEAGDRECITIPKGTTPEIGLGVMLGQNLDRIAEGFVAEFEGAFGFVAEVDARVLGLVNVGAGGDAATFRASVGTESGIVPVVRATQGAFAEAFVGPGGKATFGFHGSVSRTGAVGRRLRPEQRLRNQPFQTTTVPQAFLGIDFSAALLFGISVQIGLDLDEINLRPACSEKNGPAATR